MATYNTDTRITYPAEKHGSRVFFRFVESLHRVSGNVDCVGSVRAADAHFRYRCLANVGAFKCI